MYNSYLDWNHFDWTITWNLWMYNLKLTSKEILIVHISVFVVKNIGDQYETELFWNFILLLSKAFDHLGTVVSGYWFYKRFWLKYQGQIVCNG